MRSSLRAERGSLLLLNTFLIVAVLLAVSVVADVGRVVGARRALAATADQAAIAGAQAVDFDAYYAGGADGLAGMPLDPAAVQASVHRYLRPAIAAQQHPALAVESVGVDASHVTVTLRSSAPLAFASLLGLPSLGITASASAALLIQP